MEYTNDVIWGEHYKNDKVKKVTFRKNRRLRSLIRKIENDEFFSFSIIVSLGVLYIDFLMVKKFVEIINLL